MDDHDSQFREIFEKSPIGILFYDKNGQLTDANQSALEISRISEFRDIKGTNLFDNPYVESHKEELLKNGFIKFESPMDLDKIKEQGFYTPTESGTIYIDYIASVTNSGFLMQIQDVTKQRQGEKQELLEQVPQSAEELEDSHEDTRLNRFLHTIQIPWVNLVLRYGAAILAVIVAFLLYWAITAYFGPGLPTYILFYPAVIIVALLAGLGPGILTTLLAVIVAGIWIIPLNGESTIETPINEVGAVLFASIGIMISSVAELYRRNRRKAAAYDKEVALRKIQREKEFLANILEHASQPFAVGYLDGQLGILNNAFEQLTGYTAEELRNIDWSVNLTPRKWWELEKQKLDELHRTGQPVRYEKEYIHKDGSRVPIELLVHMVSDAEGKPEYYYSFITNITERKQAEEKIKKLLEKSQQLNEELEVSNEELQETTEELQVSNEELRQQEEELRQARDHLEELVEERTIELKLASAYNRSLIEASLDPLVTIGPDGKINDVNTATELVTEYSRDELIGTDFSNYFTEPQKAKSGYQQVFREGEVRDYPLEIKHKNGHVTPVLYHASVYRDESGEVIGVFASARDITEINKARDNLNEVIEELKRSNKELQSFAYITSHDLQEPLRSIASYAQLIERRYKGQLDSDADDFLDYMVAGATRLQGMIKGLLEYSRVGTRGEEFKEFNAEEALKYALSGLESSISKCNVEVIYDPLPVIHADESQISRVFQNLIGNALKFRKEGVQPKVHIKARKEGNEYIFSVQDNGIGIEKQYTDRIFEVFKRLHAIGEYQGAGIGLAIVKRIIEHHHGRIWVESEFGVGSTFYFTIPGVSK